MIDPSGMTVSEVVAHVSAHPEDRDAVLAAEAGGKNRKSLLAALRPPADPDETSDGGSEPVPLVRGRWVSVQAVDAVEQGVVLYGDPIDVTAEQLDDPNTPVVAWVDDWEPDPDLHHQSRLFDAESPDQVPDGFIHNLTPGS